VLAGLSLPHVEHEVPLCTRVQLTPAFAGSFCIVGVKFWVMFIGMRAETGETETVIARTVTVTEPDCVGSEIEVAVMLTDKFAGGGAEGAVYVTEVLVGLLRVPPPNVGEVIFQDAGSTP
jgi:hypothetical protein